MLEDEGGDARQTSLPKPKAKAKALNSGIWLYFLLAIAFLLLLTLQPVLKKMSDDNIFTAPQIIYDVSLFIGVLIGLPSLAIVGWKYLKRQPKLRSGWEMWPLAIGGAIFIPGCIVLAFMNLFTLAELIAQFAIVLLFVVIGASALVIFSLLVLIIHMEIMESANRWQTRPGDES